MALRFEPPVDVARFALSIGKFFRTYDSVARAKIAFHSHTNYVTDTARILELVEGQWFVLYEVENPRGLSRWSEDGRKPPWYKETHGSWRTNYQRRFKATPMSPEEYAAWRIQVDHELLAQKPIEQIIQLFDTVSV